MTAQKSLQSYELPDLEEQLRAAIDKEPPCTGWFIKFRDHLRVSNGSTEVRIYLRRIAYRDPELDDVPVRLRDSFYLDGGMNSAACPAEEIFFDLLKMRDQGDDVLKAYLFDRYKEFRGAWLANLDQEPQAT